jgi:hypothetical protein
MAELHVSLDSDKLTGVEHKLQDQLEEQLTASLRDAAAVVAEAYDGQSEDEVAQWILAETRQRLHPDIASGFQPDDAKLRQVAQTIIRGEPLA